MKNLTISIILTVFVIFLTLSSGAIAAPKILTSIKPVQAITSAVTDGVTSPELLIEGNQSPHDFAFRPSHLRKLSSADIVIIVGDSLESFASKRIMKQKQVIKLIDIEGLYLLKDEEHEDEHHYGHKDENYTDPHIWLSPANAIKIAEYLAEYLSKKDATNAEKYIANRDDFIASVNSEVSKIRNALQPFTNKDYIVFHDAYKYFSRYFGLKDADVIAESTGHSFSAQKISEINSLIKLKNINCLIAEPNGSSSLLKSLDNSDNIKLVTIDPIGNEIKAGKKPYLGIINNISDKFISCLQ